MTVNALKVATSVSGSFITAGTPFTISTSVTNAHDEKIEILEYYYHIPYQVQWIHEANYGKAYEQLQSRNALARFFTRSPWKKTAQPPGQEMKCAYLEDPEKSIADVLPGENTIYAFKAIIPRWLLIAGTEITFEGRVTYRYKAEKHISTFRVSFIVRPPLGANIAGAICGGALGTTAKWLRQLTTSPDASFDFTFLSASALSIILAIVMVVFSSRRTSDVQPILTIEDFWGGMLAGFLVGYLGHEFFGKVVTIAQ